MTTTDKSLAEKMKDVAKMLCDAIAEKATCPHCSSANVEVQPGNSNRKRIALRCNDCSKPFSLRA